jgi:hypothetical protein
MSSSSISSSLPTTPRPQPLGGSTWLRRGLWIDVLFSGVAGVAMGAGHTLLAPVLGLPEGLLIGAALVCLAWAAALGALARRSHMPRLLVWDVILGNGAWVAASIALLAFDWVQPTGLGTAFLVAQAVVVGVFAELLWWAMRREA